MIVVPLFEGDDDCEVALKQHDVYGDALAIIVSTCKPARTLCLCRAERCGSSGLGDG